MCPTRLPVAAWRAAVLALACTALLGSPAQAQWKWRDANGRITASDRPPPREVPDKDILNRPGMPARRAAAAAAAPASAASAARPAASASGLQAEVETRRRIAEQGQAAKAREDEQRQAAVRQQNCTRARQYVANLESGMRIARTNDKGEREILDDAARASELRAARVVIASDCR